VSGETEEECLAAVTARFLICGWLAAEESRMIPAGFRRALALYSIDEGSQMWGPMEALESAAKAVGAGCTHIGSGRRHARDKGGRVGREIRRWADAMLPSWAGQLERTGESEIPSATVARWAVAYYPMVAAVESAARLILAVQAAWAATVAESWVPTWQVAEADRQVKAWTSNFLAASGAAFGVMEATVWPAPMWSGGGGVVLDPNDPRCSAGEWVPCEGVRYVPPTNEPGDEMTDAVGIRLDAGPDRISLALKLRVDRPGQYKLA
jgi:hypothetical protein